MTTTSIFLTVTDAARELGISEAAVMRLIALRELKAVLVGGVWLIAPEDLKAYVARGAPNLEGPSREGDWLDDQPDAWIAGEQFVPAVQAAAVEDGQVPEEWPGVDEKAITVTDRIRQAITAKPDDTFSPPGDPLPDLADVRIAYLVTVLRAEAKAVIEKRGDLSAGFLEQLYAGPDEHSRIVGEALRRAKAGVLFIDRKVYATAAPGPGDPGHRFTRFVLPHAALFVKGMTKLAVARAF